MARRYSLHCLCFVLTTALLPGIEPTARGQQVRPITGGADIYAAPPNPVNPDPFQQPTGRAFSGDRGVTTDSRFVNGSFWWHVDWGFFSQGWSESRNLQQISPIPSPLLPAPTPLGPGSVTAAAAPTILVVNPELKWTAVAGADDYYARLWVFEGTQWLLLDDAFTSASTSFFIRPGILKANRSYSWDVWTYNIDGKPSIISSRTLYFKTLVNLDVISPVLSITSPAAGAVFEQPAITVTGTASDARGLSKVIISFNNALEEVAVGTSNWTFAATLRAGSNTISAYSVDNAGNPSPPATITATYIRDTIPPTVKISQPTANLITGQAVFVFSGTANDNKTTAAVEVRWDSNNWVPASGTTSWTYSSPLGVGRHTFSVRSRDTSGNLSLVSTVVVSRRSLLATVTPLPSPQPGSLKLRIAGTPGMGYFVESSSTLAIWQRVTGSDFLGLADGNEITLPDQIQGPVSFFRVAENAQ